MSIIQGNAKQGSTRGFYPKVINGSLRFNDDDSAYLSWTPASAGNRKTWTWSAWVKLGTLGTNRTLLGGGASSSDRTYFGILADNQFRFVNTISGTSTSVEATLLLRDPSAWYHIVVACDTTQATPADRLTLYINGEEITAFDQTGYPAQNANTQISNNNIQALGSLSYSAANFWDGYLANVHFIDGQALTASDFGETKNGVWVAKDYAGTFGTNGFYLDFANSADIGNDISGNANDWTPNNFTASDVVLDSPTDNFATLNPLGTNDISSFSEGNLKITTGSGASASGATMGMSSGKWYAEFVCTAKTSVNFGIALIKADTFDGDNQPDEGNNVGYFWLNNANIYHGFASDSYGSSFNTGDVLGVAFDADTLALQFYINGTGQGNYTRVASENTAGDAWIFGCGEGQGSATATFVANFGQDSSFAGNKTAQGNTDENGRGDFYYAPPSGYLALCTANLPDPVIDPAQDASPADHFGTLLWTGNTDTGTRTITDATSGVTGEVNFTPDWVWTKSRSATGSHALFDVVRGDNKYLTSNGTGAEITNPSSGYLDSFTDGGFVAQEGSSNFANLNTNGTTYVAWCWKAGGTAVSNTDGSITSTVSANTDAGFSIVTTDNHTSSKTVGHGLDQAPDMIIAKARNGALLWPVYHSALGNTKRLRLNDTTAQETNAVWGNTDPTTSVFTFNQSSSTYDYVFYCFHSVEGFSRFSSYVGNGSTDGPFVYTGFRPAMVIAKRTDGTSNWLIFDSKRDPDNAVNSRLFPDLSNAEDSTDSFDFLSNGFKLRRSSNPPNGSGMTYIYMAFAENPFKYSNAR